MMNRKIPKQPLITIIDVFNFIVDKIIFVII